MLHFKCCSRVCITQTMGPLLLLDPGLLALHGIWPYHCTPVLSLVAMKLVHEDKVQFGIQNLWDIEQIHKY